MSTTTRKLRMKFGNEDGNKDITIDNPLTDLDSETTANAMNDIVALETLVDNKGNDFFAEVNKPLVMNISTRPDIDSAGDTEAK